MKKMSITCAYLHRAVAHRRRHPQLVRDADGHSDSYGNSYSYSDGYGNSHSYAYSNINSNSYGHSQADTDAKSSGDAESPSHAPPPAIAMTLCRRAQQCGRASTERGGYNKPAQRVRCANFQISV